MCRFRKILFDNPVRTRLMGMVLSIFITVMSSAAHGLDSDSDGMPDSWENAHSLNVSSNDASADADLDGITNYKEYVADTDPQDKLSFPKFELEWNSELEAINLSAMTSSSRVYRVDFSTNLLSGVWTSLVTSVSGGGYKVLATDTNLTTPSRFYKMIVGFPALLVLPTQMDFGSVAIGSTSAVQTVYLTNDDSIDHTLMMIVREGGNANDFILYGLPSTNLLMAPQQTVQFDVAFAPAGPGLRNGKIKNHFDNHSTHLYVDAHGVGEYHYFVNAGGPNYTDPSGNLWEADTGYYNTGNTFETANEISGTTLDPLYQTERYDPANALEMVYSFPVSPGPYVVRLHFAEIYEGNNTPGKRIFDVNVEGETALADYDVVADVGFETAAVKELYAQVNDNSLDIEFIHNIENPKISAIEILSGSVIADNDDLAWGHVTLGATGTVRQIELTNTGLQSITIDTISFLLISGAAHDFILTIDGITYTGGDEDVMIPVNITLAAGQSKTLTLKYLPTEPVENDAWLRLSGDFPSVNIRMQGTGGTGTGHPFLHIVTRVPEVIIDYDNNGFESVFLDGTESHTHEFGHVLQQFEWSTNGTVFSTNQTVTQDFPLGSNLVSFAIFDDNVPPETITNNVTVLVSDVSSVPGSIQFFYEGVAGGGERNPVSMLTAPPIHPDYALREPRLRIDADAGKIGGSPYTNQVMVRMVAQLNVDSLDSYDFTLTGGTTNLLMIDEVPYAGSVMLAAGQHDLEARFAVAATNDLPLEILYGKTGESVASIPASIISHDETDLVPVINTAPSEGINLGGNPIEITGLGFFPADQVVVHWGSQTITGASLTVTSEKITLLSPPGTGLVNVSVETPNGTSDSFVYGYTIDGPVPVAFVVTQAATATAPTQGEWGPDGRFYFGAIDGTITALSFDDNYTVTNAQVITALQSFTNNNILGIGFNPYDDPSSVKIYVSHSLLFANGGSCFTGFSPYSGAVSTISGPDFDTVETLIDGLPVSNHDHGVNGIQFDNLGRMLVAVGGNSNAGVPSCPMGDLPESPLSAAILRADITKSNFNGHIIYRETAGGAVNDDQVYGGVVDVETNVDISIVASGLRNSYDMVYTTAGQLYAMDNGPNAGFGASSTSATTEGPDPEQGDTLNRIVEGAYYGHPNRNRGRYDDRQNVYYNNNTASVPGGFSQAMSKYSPSVNGIDEYRSTTFDGAMRGELLIQKWNGTTYRVKLSGNGASTASSSPLPATLNGLDVVCSPGGAILGVDYTDNQILVAKPSDISAIGLKAFDIFPWRAPVSGGHPFVIGGSGFGNLANTTVSIGSTAATLTYVSTNRIRGIIPATTNATSDLLDVTVSSGGSQVAISNAFRYLPAPGAGKGSWTPLSNLPIALGEVSAGIINGVLYVIGEGHPATLAYDLFSNTWLPNRQARTYTGNHHDAEVINGKFYVIGGLGPDLNTVQIYDPETDSWSAGAPVPWSGGSASSALIDGKVYLAGGISGSSTVTSNAVYDPVADSWTPLAPMPVGRNHAASATDGKRFFIFGGRGPGSGAGNNVAIGFDDVLIYDPATDTWETSFDPGSTIPPLPQKRGGLGKSVYFGGEFYVMGGETTSSGTGQVAGNVYDRVDVYNPITKTWRLDQNMLTPRHGIFPVIHNESIYLPGGGISAGGSQSTAFDCFTR